MSNINERRAEIAHKVRILQARQDALIAEARALIIEVGYDSRGDPGALRRAAVDLLDSTSPHEGDVTSVSSHWNLYT